jgi:hypothetical protein
VNLNQSFSSKKSVTLKKNSMKSIVLSLSVSLLFLSSVAQSDCNAGYESPLYASPTPLNTNFIYLEQITVSTAGIITGLSANNNGTGLTQMKLALYESVNNVPGNLLFSTAPLAVTNAAGTITGSIAATPIAAGTYFIGGTVNTTCTVLTCDGSASNQIFVSSSDFNNPFPANAATFMSVGGPVVNLWANITCGGNAVEENNSAFKMNYVPSRNSIQLRGASISQANVQVICMEGRVVQTIQTSLVSSGSELALNEIANGIYMVVVNVEGKRIAAERVAISK